MKQTMKETILYLVATTIILIISIAIWKNIPDTQKFVINEREMNYGK